MAESTLIDKHGLAERWGVEPKRINRLRRRDPPPPAEQRRPKLLFDPEAADDWARQHGPDGLDVPPEPDRDALMDKDELAERYGVCAGTVNRWRTREPPLPVAGKGEKNRNLYDPEECDRWARSYAPPDANVPLGEDEQPDDETEREAAEPDVTGEAGEIDLPDELGLEAAARRVEALERKLFRRMWAAEAPQTQDVQAYKKLTGELRQMAKSLRKEKEARGELIEWSRYEQDTTMLAAWLRRQMESWCDAAAADIAEKLAEADVVEDPKQAVGDVQQAVQSQVDEMLEGLARKLRELQEVEPS